MKFTFFFQTQINYDFLTIYDGENAQATQIGKLSGDIGQIVILSTGSYLFIEFESNGIYNFDGFFATIHFSM